MLPASFQRMELKTHSQAMNSTERNLGKAGLAGECVNRIFSINRMKASLNSRMLGCCDSSVFTDSKFSTSVSQSERKGERKSPGRQGSSWLAGDSPSHGTSPPLEKAMFVLFSFSS